MLSRLFFTFSLACIYVASEKCSSFYRIKPICDITYGTLLTMYENVLSLIGCSRSCDGTPLCRSYIFNPTSRTCYVNSQTLLTPQATCGIDVIYAENVEKTFTDQSSHSASMPDRVTNTTVMTSSTVETTTSPTVFTTTTTFQTTTTTKPTTTNPITADAFCTGGTRYNPVSALCVQECPGAYGATFQHDPQKRLDYESCSNKGMMSGTNVNIDACRQACVDSAACKTFMFRESDKYCEYFSCTSSLLTASNPSAYYEDPITDMWHRDCQ